MKTIAQLAKQFKVKPGTLSVRLWTAGIECSSYKMVGGSCVKQYNADRVNQIKDYLKRKPIRNFAGRPKKVRKA